jgi:hypothetical protein
LPVTDALIATAPDEAQEMVVPTFDQCFSNDAAVEPHDRHGTAARFVVMPGMGMMRLTRPGQEIGLIRQRRVLPWNLRCHGRVIFVLQQGAEVDN